LRCGTVWSFRRPAGPACWQGEEAVLETILVTGGAGYIGSHAAEALLEAGHAVVVYDDLSAGHREAVEALRAGRAASRVTLVEADIRDTARLEAALREHRASAVMHFAAWLAVADSVRDPIGYYRNNVTGALSVLEAMVRASVGQFVLSSTCAVFGNPERTPIDEDQEKRPINAYGETKLAIERALPHYELAYGIRFVALRYFNAAGAHPAGLLGEDHLPEIHLIPRAIAAASGGEPLQIFGTDYATPDGTCLRDYIHVSDLADAHVRALGWIAERRSSATFNLGNGTPHSVRQVIDSVERVTRRRVPHEIAPRREGDPAVLFASNARVRAGLGWAPRFAELDTIVESAWRWHQAHPEGYGRRGYPVMTSS
jgi:UDP-glucose-4-epimerase GalE